MESPYPDLSELQSYVGKHKSELPSPSLCLSLPIVQENARVFHENVEKSGLEFRAHVKSNKVSTYLVFLNFTVRELIEKDSGDQSYSFGRKM
jgi:hypothetical protein